MNRSDPNYGRVCHLSQNGYYGYLEYRDRINQPLKPEQEDLLREWCLSCHFMYKCDGVLKTEDGNEVFYIDALELLEKAKNYLLDARYQKKEDQGGKGKRTYILTI